MLQRYEDALRAAADIVAAADRDTRRKLVSVIGREERYSEKLITMLEERLDGFSEGGVRWEVLTNITDKQSGQETRTGADLLIALNMKFDGFSVSKGVQVQAKVNSNKVRGFGVDSRSRLNRQCEIMLGNSPESYVFSYGRQITKIVKAQAVLDLRNATLSDIVSLSVSDFFYDFFICRVGDRDMTATSHADLQRLTSRLEAKAGVVLRAAQTESV